MDKTFRAYFNEDMETLTADDLNILHQKRFLDQVAYVYENSPFYSDKFNSAGISPASIKTLCDIEKIPFTEKHELREAQKSRIPIGRHRSCSEQELRRVYSSSGTTGVPTYIGLTKDDIYNVQAEAIARVCWAGGVRPDSKVVNIPTAPFIADTFREGIEKTGATHIPTGFNTDRVISAFRYQGANALHATVSFWSYLLDELESKGINPKKLGMKSIIGGAEGGTKNVRHRIEEGFGATVIEGMGMGEIVCTVFGECVENRGNGMHYLTQGLVHVELIDPETLMSKEIKEGATGELVYTALQSKAMPLIRYRSRDHIRVVSTGKCVCGRTGFRIEVIGRTDDMLTILGVNVFPMAIRDVISTAKPRVTGVIEIQMEKPGPVAEPPLWIKVEAGNEPGDVGVLQKHLETLLRDRLIFRAKVEIVDELPKYQYKTKIINKLYGR